MLKYISLSLNTIVLTILIFPSVMSAQTDPMEKNERSDIRFMFYNTENFFDTKNDSVVQDDEYTHEGIKHWNYKRFNEKMMNIFKVIAAIGEWQPPEIVAFAEIENKFVLNQLVDYTPLSKFDYGIVHKESEDPRGIDVALLYRKDKLKLLSDKYIHVKIDNNSLKKTRDILYAKLETLNKDTLHIFINHWPSRKGGESLTSSYRIKASETLKHVTDSLLKYNSSEYILITGDFNDTPNDSSILLLSVLINTSDTILPDTLYNLSEKSNYNGTIKYNGYWNTFDQFIVSGNLLTRKNSLSVSSTMNIFSESFLLEEDKKFFGVQPYRTYNGMHYNYGYSDHLPVYIDIFSISNE